MHLLLLLGAALAMAAVPVACLAVLLLTGATAAGPALLAMGAVVLAALALAALWARDMVLLAETLRHAAQETGPALAPAAVPRLPPIERIARSIERLA
ncbi:hypothetical protein, partial [Limobrevibacterium gyesilva]|nr:hypothetical protein [Limobrevibacterium gyesilva]